MIKYTGCSRNTFRSWLKKIEGSKELNEMVSSTIENMKSPTKKKPRILCQRSMSYLILKYIYEYKEINICIYIYIYISIGFMNLRLISATRRQTTNTKFDHLFNFLMKSITSRNYRSDKSNEIRGVVWSPNRYYLASNKNGHKYSLIFGEYPSITYLAYRYDKDYSTSIIFEKLEK